MARKWNNVIRVSDEAMVTVQKYAEEKGIGVYEATEALISVGDRRRAAWRRYQPKKSRPKRSK